MTLWKLQGVFLIFHVIMRQPPHLPPPCPLPALTLPLQQHGRELGNLQKFVVATAATLPGFFGGGEGSLRQAPVLVVFQTNYGQGCGPRD